MNTPERQINSSKIENLPQEPKPPANPNSVAEILKRGNPDEIEELDERYSVKEKYNAVDNPEISKYFQGSAIIKSSKGWNNEILRRRT